LFSPDAPALPGDLDELEGVFAEAAGAVALDDHGVAAADHVLDDGVAYP
jgi:hypothetical protein